MRFLTSLACIFAVASIAACGGSKSNGGGGGGGGSGGGGSGSSGGGGTGGGGGSSAACAPSAACPAVDKSCLGLVDNSGTTKFGLRMSQVTFAHPTAFTSGIVNSTIDGATGLPLPSCNLESQGTFSWLLQFDTTAGTLTTGGAKPVADPTTGYAFDSEMLSGFAVQSVTMNATPDASGKFTVATGTTLDLPIFLNSTGTSVLLLPLQQARISMGTLSSSHNCIGSYNAAGLDPSMSCQPSTTTPAFINGGSFDGFIKLTDADQVVVAPLNESLCVLLSANPTMYGDGASPAHCKTDAGGAIIFQGDWCSTTNAAATVSCADAVQLNGQFAASSVKID